jgi:phosphoglycerate dehydrogenase-like enzyme
VGTELVGTELTGTELTSTEVTGAKDAYAVGLTADGFRKDGTSIFGEIDTAPLQAAGFTCRLVEPPHDPLDVGSLAGLDAVISFGHAPFTAESARRLPRLKHVARFGAGYDGIDPVGLAAEGVIVTTTPTAVRAPLAQAALALLLACAHRLIENHQSVVGGRWSDERGNHRGAGLVGKVVGIVGLGGVGSLLATYVRALGAEVIATGRSGSKDQAERAGIRFVGLSTLAAASDYVVVTASLTLETTHLLDAAFFTRMRPSAWFINVARGGLVDQPALAAALTSGDIAGAALDVLEDEPPAQDEPLLSLGNVILSPHALCWTEQFTLGGWESVLNAIMTVASGSIPDTALVPDQLHNDDVPIRALNKWRTP